MGAKSQSETRKETDIVAQIDLSAIVQEKGHKFDIARAATSMMERRGAVLSQSIKYRSIKYLTRSLRLMSAP
jgi:hypothetical protein